jgi:hypothetical protein
MVYTELKQLDLSPVATVMLFDPDKVEFSGDVSRHSARGAGPFQVGAGKVPVFGPPECLISSCPPPQQMTAQCNFSYRPPKPMTSTPKSKTPSSRSRPGNGLDGQHQHMAFARQDTWHIPVSIPRRNWLRYALG